MGTGPNRNRAAISALRLPDAARIHDGADAEEGAGSPFGRLSTLFLAEQDGGALGARPFGMNRTRRDLAGLARP